MARSRKRVNVRSRTVLRAKGITATKPLDADYEPRPNVRVWVRKNLTRKEYQRFRQIGLRALKQLQENIRSGMQGRWLKVQWDYQNGVSAGDDPLQGTEDQWKLVMTSSRTMQLRPKQQYAQRWRGHVHGMDIYAKTPRGMRVPFRSGTAYRQHVKLPKRDPRPTRTQLMRISKER